MRGVVCRLVVVAVLVSVSGLSRASAQTTISQWNFNGLTNPTFNKPSSGTILSGTVLGFGQGAPSSSLTSITFNGTPSDAGTVVSGTTYNRSATINPPLLTASNTSVGVMFLAPTTGMGAGEAVKISWSQTVGYRSSRYWQLLVSTSGTAGPFTAPSGGTGSSISQLVNGFNSGTSAISGTATVNVSSGGVIDFRTINGNWISQAVTTSGALTAPLPAGFVDSISFTLPTGQGYENNANFAFGIVGLWDPSLSATSGTTGLVSSFSGTDSTDLVNGYNRAVAAGGSMRLDLMTVLAVPRSAASLTWNAGSGTWSTSSTDWSGGGTFVNGDSVTFSGSAGGAITLSGSLQPGSFTVSATAGTYTFGGGAGNLISGTGGLQKSGAGVAVISSDNGWSGGTTLSAGTVRVGSDGALGSGTLSLNGGVIASAGSAARSLGNAVSFGGDVAIGDGVGTGAMTFGGGVDLGGATRSITTVVDTTLSGTLGNGGLTKLGAGRLTLTGSSSYSGDTTVSAGTLRIDGTVSTSHVVVGSGGTLGGVGSVGGLLTVRSGGTLAPGSSPGLLTASTLELDAGSTTVMELVGSGSAAGVAGTDYDSVTVTGNITWGGTLSLDFQNVSAFDGGTLFQLFTVGGGSSGHLGGVTATGSGDYASMVFTGDGGGIWTGTSVSFPSQVLMFSESTGRLEVLAVVPEPSGWITACVGVACAGWIARRRGRTAPAASTP